tara:strand:+ start:225 stop:668 length:444 start_codon:yes stop_codon:yes gene_type:complete
MKKLLYLKDNELKHYIEKIFMVYKETTLDAKKVMDEYSMGVAHNKVMHLISLYDGITISELLKKLKITKQSLNRVLKELSKLKIINYKKNEKDTRIKHVFLTDEGKKLFDKVFSIQKKRLHNAFLESDSNEVVSFEKVLKKIINEKI